MDEWAKYNERIIEILIARQSENIEIIVLTMFCCTCGFGEKKTRGNISPINISRNNEDLLTVILKCTDPGADTGGVDRVDIHPPFFSKKKFEMSLYLK